MKNTRLLPAARVSVIAFDLNGTLIKWREAFDESFKSEVKEWVGRWSEAEEEDVVGQTLLKYHQQRVQWSKGNRGKGLQESRREWMRQVLEDLPLPSNDAVINAIIDGIRQKQSRHARLADGAKEALAQLSKKYKLAVISDTNRETVLEMWERLGMANYIPESRLFTPPPSGAKKPSGARFRAVTEALRVSPSRCVMVGDSWKRDISGAVHAGWNAIWLSPQTKTPASRRFVDGKPVASIGSLTALPRLLR